MGVMTRLPVELVPMTLPPWKSSGGVPRAGLPALLMAPTMRAQAPLAGSAPMTPEMWPARTGALAFERQEAPCDAGVAASADPPARARVAAPAATRVRVIRWRLFNALFIPV